MMQAERYRAPADIRFVITYRPVIQILETRQNTAEVARYRTRTDGEGDRREMEGRRREAEKKNAGRPIRDGKIERG